MRRDALGTELDLGGGPDAELEVGVRNRELERVDSSATGAT